MSESEIRTIPVEVRAITGDDGRRVIEGRAIVYDAWSEDLGGFREMLVPGSANLTSDLLALFDHDTSMVLGRTSSGTLEAHDDGSGVVMRAFPPDTSWARDLLVSMDRGDIRQMSFRLRVNEDEWNVVDGEVQRVIRDMDVDELSVVSMPAYPQTSANARSKAAELRARVSDGEPIIPVTDNGEAGGSPEEPSENAPGSGDSLLYRAIKATHRPRKE